MKTKNQQKKRRPKGMGSITNLGTGRSRPWMASVCDSPIGYFKEYRDAEICLLHYFLKQFRMMPSQLLGQEKIEFAYTEYIYDLQEKGKLEYNIRYITDSELEDYNQIFLMKLETKRLPVSNMNLSLNKVPTFAEIWDIVFDEEVSKKSKSTQVNYKTAFNKFEELHNVEINKIKTLDIQPIFDERISKITGKQTLINMKVVCKLIFMYAIRYEYVSTNYSDYIILREPTGTKKESNITRHPFTGEEIATIYKDGSFESKIVMIYIMTGMRPIELLNMKIENIDLDKRIMIGGVKTESGKNRIIPIHDYIFDFIKELVTSSNDGYLFYNKLNRGYAYEKYRKEIYQKLMNKISLKHSNPYDTRKTFADLCFYNHMDQYATKKIMGHSIQDITLGTYTTATEQYLTDELSKIRIKEIDMIIGNII